MSRIRPLLFVALFAALMLFVPKAVSANPGVQVMYHWVMNFDFENNSDDGVLTVTVRFLYPNGSYQDFVSTPTVACAPKGNVTVANGKATFANGSHLKCTLPSIRDEIIALYPPATPSDYQDPFWVRTVTAVDTSISTPLSGNPIFVHPDMRVYLPYNSAGAGSAQARIVTADHDTISPPYAPSVPSTMTINQRNWFDEQGTPACSVRFVEDGSSMPLDPYGCPLFNEAMNFHLDAATIFIGASPVDKTFYTGEILDLVIDPVEWGVLD